VKKNKAGQTRWSTSADVIELVQVLARQMSDTSIAAALNRCGKTTGRGNGWSRASVCSLRYQNEIPVYREGERAERGEVTLDEAANILAISRTMIRRLIRDRVLPAQQICQNAPWILRHDDLVLPEVRREVDGRRRRRPEPENPLQNALRL
jgi:Helix-turn-helix domain